MRLMVGAFRNGEVMKPYKEELLVKIPLKHFQSGFFCFEHNDFANHSPSDHQLLY